MDGVCFSQPPPSLSGGPPSLAALKGTNPKTAAMLGGPKPTPLPPPLRKRSSAPPWPWPQNPPPVEFVPSSLPRPFSTILSQNRRFPPGFRWIFSEKKDPWKEWEASPRLLGCEATGTLLRLKRAVTRPQSSGIQTEELGSKRSLVQDSVLQTQRETQTQVCLGASNKGRPSPSTGFDATGPSLPEEAAKVGQTSCGGAVQRL